MRCMAMALVLFTITIAGTCPSRAEAPPTHRPNGEAASSAGKPLLTMIHIRTSSPGALKQLRAMHLIDIIKVRPDPERPADKNSLTRSLIVEAVAPTDILPKLRAKGFDVSEIPPKDK